MLIGKKKKEEVEDICVKGRYTYNVSTKSGFFDPPSPPVSMWLALTLPPYFITLARPYPPTPNQKN